MCDSCYEYQESLLESGDGSQVVCLCNVSDGEEEEEQQQQPEEATATASEDQLQSTPTQELLPLPEVAGPSRLRHPRSRLNATSTPIPMANLSPPASPSTLTDDEEILHDEVAQILAEASDEDIIHNNDNNDNDNDSIGSFESGVYVESNEGLNDAMIEPDDNDVPLDRYAGVHLVPLELARAAPQAQFLPALHPHDNPDIMRPVPIALQPPLQLRHRISSFNFDGDHNNDSLYVQYEENDNQETDDDATHFDGYRNNLWTVHVTTLYTLTIQNLYTHDTRTRTGTYTHSYRTRRRNHRLQFVQTLPISFRGRRQQQQNEN
jgi:hypothetical protein